MTFTGRAQVLIAWSTEPFNPSPTWTDVTAWIRLDKSLSLQRGRQDNITAISAGRLTLTADNSDGRFTVGRSTSPWAPNVKIGRRLQVNIPDETGTLHTRFDGLITELPLAWEGGPGIENLAVIQAADILSWVSRQPSLLSWTQQEMLADAPSALWSLADASSVTQATDQAGQGAQPLRVLSQGDGSGVASPGGGVPLTEIQVSNVQPQVQQVQTFTFQTAGTIEWTAPLGTLVSCKVECVGGGQAGTTGSGAGGAGGKGAEYAAEPTLAVTPGTTYTGSVGLPGVPSAGNGGDTTFTGDSVTVTGHGGGSGSTSSNTVHHSGGSGGAGGSNDGGGGGSSGGAYQAGNNGGGGTSSTAGGGGTAAASGGGGGGGDTKPALGSGAGGSPGSQPGGGGGGGASAVGGGGGVGQITITYTYIPPVSSQQNSAISSWLFTPSATLAARILSGALPQPVTAAAGFAFECWAGFASFPAAAITPFMTPGSITWTAPPGGLTADAVCIAGGNAGTNGGGGGAGGTGAEYAEEPSLAITPDVTYAGSVGSPGAPSAGTGTDSTFTGDSVTVHAHASGSGSSNTVHHSGGSGGAAGSNDGGGGGSSGGTYQAGNNGVAGTSTTAGSAGAAVAGGGGGGNGDAAGTGTSGTGGTPGAQPGGGGGGGASNQGGAGGPGQITVTVQPTVSTLLTLVQPRGQAAIAVWVTATGHLQLASTSGYGTRAPSWTTVDAGQVPSAAFHVAVSVASSTGIATLYVNGVSAGTLTLPAGASYTAVTAGGAYGAWLGGWNGSAGLLAVYPAPLTSTRIGVHHTAGTTGFIGTSTGNMIAKIAGYIGLPSFWYTAPTGTSDPSYGLTLVSYADLNGQQPLAAMQKYEQAETGVLAVNAAGKLVFADRASRYAAGAGGSAFVLTAGQYEPDTSFKSNDQYLATEACFATADIPGGFPVTNGAAETDFGPYIQQAGSVSSPQSVPFADATGTAGSYSTDDIMDAGWWEVNVLGEPVSRVPALTVDLLTLPASEFSIASFYGLDIGSAVQLAGLPSQAPDSTGQPLAAYHVIEGINETLTLNAHTAQLYTSPLAQNAAWIPGDALLGVLGTTDTIGRSQAPTALGPPYFPVPTFGATLNRTGSAGAQDMRTLAVSTQARLTPPLLIAQQAAAQTLVTAAGQPVTFDTLLADTAGGMGATTTYTIPAGFAGWYWLAAVVQAATGNGSLGGLTVWFAVTLSGVASQWHARSLPYLSTAPYGAVGISGKAGPFSAGDTVQVICAWSGTATSVPLGTTDGGSMFTLMWEGYT